MILILNLISLPPITSLLSSTSFISEFFFIVMNNIASLFLNIEANYISYVLFDNYIADFL